MTKPTTTGVVVSARSQWFLEYQPGLLPTLRHLALQHSADDRIDGAGDAGATAADGSTSLNGITSTNGITGTNGTRSNGMTRSMGMAFATGTAVTTAVATRKPSTFSGTYASSPPV